MVGADVLGGRSIILRTLGYVPLKSNLKLLVFNSKLLLKPIYFEHNFENRKLLTVPVEPPNVEKYNLYLSS